MIQDAHGQPSTSASCAPTAPASSSMAWRPHSTSCGASSVTTAASARAVVSVSALASAGSFTWMARSQPMASAERSVSLARSGPSVTATTSPWPRFSLMRSASSMANSSYGDTIQVMPAVSIAFGSLLIFTCVAVSGTCLTATRIFMRGPLGVTARSGVRG